MHCSTVRSQVANLTDFITGRVDQRTVVLQVGSGSGRQQHGSVM